MKNKSVFRGRKYGCEDFKNLVISLLEKAAESGAQPIKKIIIKRIPVGEQGIIDDEYDRGQEMIEFTFYKAVRNQGDVRKLIEAVKAETDYYITVAALILKKLNESEYLVKLFGKFFFVETDFEIWSWDVGKLRRFLVADTRNSYPPPARFHEISCDEVLLLLL